MIDEKATFEKYGYYSTDLKPKSNKRIVAVCDECGAVRYPKKYGYHDFCHHCVKLVKYLSDNTRILLSEARIGSTRSDETRAKMSKDRKGKKRPPFTDDTRAKMSKSATERKSTPHSEERCQHISAGLQGIPYEDWTGFATENQYCEKFDKACRERIREKYDYRCYICDKPQHENMSKNGNVRKLAVHHADMNKNQGCDDVQWKLIPLCMHCHGQSHFDPMKSRIDYLVRAE